MQAILVTRDGDEREILNFILRHAGVAVATTQELHRVAANWLERPADIIVVSIGDSCGLVESIEAVRGVTQVPLLLMTEPIEEKHLGSLLQAGDNLLLTAGRDVNLTAALVDSNDGAVSVAAGRDVNLLSAYETHYYSLDSYDKKKKTRSITTTTRADD